MSSKILTIQKPDVTRKDCRTIVLYNLVLKEDGSKDQ
jgi:hypothetical protein